MYIRHNLIQKFLIRDRGTLFHFDHNLPVFAFNLFCEVSGLIDILHQIPDYLPALAPDKLFRVLYQRDSITVDAFHRGDDPLVIIMHGHFRVHLYIQDACFRHD